MPVMPVCSLREPTRYQTPKLTTGALRTSFVRTRSPLGRRVSVIPAVSAGSGAGGGAWPATSVTPESARRTPSRTEPEPRRAGRHEPCIDRTSLLGRCRSCLHAERPSADGRSAVSR